VAIVTSIAAGSCLMTIIMLKFDEMKSSKVESEKFTASVSIEKVHKNGLNSVETGKQSFFVPVKFLWDRSGLHEDRQYVSQADRACDAPGKQVFVHQHLVLVSSCCLYRERCPERVQLVKLLFSIF
jgi:hypothetical protein